MDTCWIVNPELRARYPSITPWGYSPRAETGRLKRLQCEFESHYPYQIIFDKIRFRVYKLSLMQ